jgi:hypothetical protein
MTTKYSKDVKGTKTNWGYTARFDITNGLLGISQWGKASGFETSHRVLLSKSQVKAMLKFVASQANRGGVKNG